MESLETLPEELQAMHQELQSLTAEYEEGRRSLLKKRGMLLRRIPETIQSVNNLPANPDASASEKAPTLPAELRPQALQKMRKEARRLEELLAKRTTLQQDLQRLLDRHLTRLNIELGKQREVQVSPIFFCEELEDTQAEELLRRPEIDNPCNCGGQKENSSELIACCNPLCKTEWYHIKCMFTADAQVPLRWQCPTCTESMNESIQ